MGAISIKPPTLLASLRENVSVNGACVCVCVCYTLAHGKEVALNVRKDLQVTCGPPIMTSLSWPWNNKDRVFPQRRLFQRQAPSKDGSDLTLSPHPRLWL